MLLFLFAVAFTHCSKEQRDDCITSAGKEKSELRQIGAFKGVYAEDKFIVELVQDSLKAGTVEIIGPGNLLGQIRTEVKDGVLRISNGNTCNFVRSFKIRFHVKVYCSELTELYIEAAAEFHNADTLHFRNLKIFHNALSDIDLCLNIDQEVYVKSFNSAKTILRGQARVLKGSVEEVSSIDAKELQCEEVLLDHHSPIDCYIDGSRIIYVKIFNTGNIYYVQEPSELKELNYRRSTGDLIILK